MPGHSAVVVAVVVVVVVIVVVVVVVVVVVSTVSALLSLKPITDKARRLHRAYNRQTPAACSYTAATR